METPRGEGSGKEFGAKYSEKERDREREREIVVGWLEVFAS